jgi:diguanylate cyclase
VSDPTPDRGPQPVAIARIALRNLTARGLAPTPENYAHEYASVAGQPLPAEQVPGAGGPNAATMHQLESIIAQVSETSADLASGVDRFQVDTGPLLANMGVTPTREAVECLLQAFTRSTASLRQTVDTSRQELGDIRRQLDQANGELKRAKELAHTDSLTGLPNRRALNDIILRDIARARRTKELYSVAIFDIDHFKHVNDEYGHAAGDQALIHVGFVVKSGVRETDAICRYGGEEFIVLLPGAGAEGAHYVLDRLRTMVEKTPCAFGAEKITLRFSAGVAELQAGEDAERLLERADQALYQAKRAGRNRVAVSLVPPAVVLAIAR